MIGTCDRFLRPVQKVDRPFLTIDGSVEELFTDTGQQILREHIQRVDLVIFLGGVQTNSAKGVAVEFGITREESKPYFLLQGRDGKPARKPRRAEPADKVYVWTPENLRLLVGMLVGANPIVPSLHQESLATRVADVAPMA
jgi:hypothetical protein